MLVRCDASGTACTRLKLGVTWQTIALVRDGSDAFAVGYESESTLEENLTSQWRIEKFRIVQIPSAGPLSVSQPSS